MGRMATESRIIRTESERVVDRLREGTSSVHGIVADTGLKSGEVMRALLELIADEKAVAYRHGRRLLFDHVGD